MKSPDFLNNPQKVKIVKLSVKFDDAVERLSTIPGIGITSATAIIGEIGNCVDKFPTAEHFCSWAGLVPGDNKSAGKKKAQESLSAILTSRD